MLLILILNKFFRIIKNIIKMREYLTLTEGIEWIDKTYKN